MGGHDNQRANRRHNGIEAGAAEADVEHAADHEKQKGAADADDDRREVSVASETAALRQVANDAGDDDSAEERKEHDADALQLLTFGEREAPQKDFRILRAFACALQAQELHRAVAAGHGQRVVQQFARCSRAIGETGGQ